MNNILKLIDSVLVDAILPASCYLCGQPKSYICQNCFSKLPKSNRQICIECAKPSLLGLTHPNCLTKLGPDRLISFLDYNFVTTKDLIAQGKINLASKIFFDLANNFSLDFSPQGFSCAYIPMTSRDQNTRGFNQSQILSIALAKKYQLPCVNLLIKKTQTLPQKTLTKIQRQSNILNAFQINEQIRHFPAKIILVDDICTTGSTLKKATKILKKHGAATVYCLALAQD